MREIMNYSGQPVLCRELHTLIIGSGAAGLNAAVQLDAAGVKDIAVLTEGLHMGTSINTGSDKQTYYKLGMYAADNDSPEALAETFFQGGAMHGDLALVEAALSPRAFFNLVGLGVDFPRDRYGQFIGYKTDHDPLRRATSCGPYTSRDMCRALIREVARRGITVFENRNAVKLLTVSQNGEKRVAGAVAVCLENDKISWEVYKAENVVFAVGGPGGLYKTSVYPEVHNGAIGLALEAGARTRNLQESQFGLASIKFRWNVSGTYMQVLPRIFSTAPDGVSDEQEFLRDYFKSSAEMNSMIFLKGYQWPFDAAKAAGGSSLIDVLVHRETAIKGRRVFLDFRRNCSGFEFTGLSKEAYDYLARSEALLETPVERLRKMNPDAIKLYEEHNIHLVAEPLEVAVCAQHNNGGLAGNLWWESENIKHLFPIGEVNGSHGICRPGGSALNSGQVAGIRAAEFIASEYRERSLDADAFDAAATQALERLTAWTEKSGQAEITWETAREEFRQRMTRAGAQIRSVDELSDAVEAAWRQYGRMLEDGCKYDDAEGMVEALRNLHLCLAHAVYLDAVSRSVHDGTGSRGSGLVLAQDGVKLHDALEDYWRYVPENKSFRDKVLESAYTAPGCVKHHWSVCRSLPHEDGWFENIWADYRRKMIFK